MLNNREINETAELLKALSHPSRLTVVSQLIHGERNVGELAQATGLSQPAISKILASLLESNVVSRRRQGKKIFYSTARKQLTGVLVLLRSLVTQEKSGNWYEDSALAVKRTPL